MGLMQQSLFSLNSCPLHSPAQFCVFLHDRFEFSLTQEKEDWTLTSSCALNNYSKLTELAVLLDLSEKEFVGQNLF